MFIIRRRINVKNKAACEQKLKKENKKGKNDEENTQMLKE